MKKISKAQFLKIIKKIVGNNVRLSMNSEINKIKNWDSLNNVRIILELNKLLKKKIDFNNLKKVSKLLDLYEKI